MRSERAICVKIMIQALSRYLIRVQVEVILYHSGLGIGMVVIIHPEARASAAQRMWLTGTLLSLRMDFKRA